MAKQAIWPALKEVVTQPFGSPQVAPEVRHVPHDVPGPSDARVGFVPNGAADVARVGDDSHANPSPGGASGVDRLPVGPAHVHGEQHEHNQYRRDQGELDKGLAALAGGSSGPGLRFHHCTRETEPTLCWPGPGPPVVLKV
jgi:hypothetical protein